MRELAGNNTGTWVKNFGVYLILILAVFRLFIYPLNAALNDKKAILADQRQTFLMKSRLLDRARMTEDADTGRESRKIQAVLYSSGARLSEIQAEMLADLSRCAAAKGLKVAGFETPEPATAGKFSEITVVMRLSGDARSCVELLKDIRDNKKTLIVKTMEISSIARR